MSKADAKARRVTRIAQLLKEGRTDREIAEREGMDATNLSKFYKDNGLTVPAKRKATKSMHPFGVHSKSALLFNRRLSDKIYELRQMGYEAEDVAAMTGVTEKQQNLTTGDRADAKVERHNFTVSQMERLADALGITFIDLIAYCTKESS